MRVTYPGRGREARHGSDGGKGDEGGLNGAAEGGDDDELGLEGGLLVEVGGRLAGEGEHLAAALRVGGES